MAQKKSLAKNRKRKAMFRNANPGIFPIKSYIKPKLEITFAIDESMRDIISSLKGADPKQFAMAYNNDGPIGVIFAPKVMNVKLEESPYSKYLIENNQEILERNTGVVVGMDLATESDKIYNQKSDEWIQLNKAATLFYNHHMNNSF